MSKALEISNFPPRILEVLIEMADRSPKGGLGPWQYADGTDAQDDANAAISELRRLAAENQALLEERTAWRVTAENAEASAKQARIDALEEARRLVWKNDTAAGADRAIESLKGQP